MIFKIIGLISSGFALGLLHSIEADHVAAVSTFVAQKPKLGASVRTGALWGAGHTLTVLFIGILVLCFKLQIPGSFSHLFESLVGIMLMYLGLLSVKNNLLNEESRDLQGHGPPAASPSKRANPSTHKPLIVGMIHGLAGSAGILLLVVAAMQNVFEGLFLILFFGAGSILGMITSGGIIAAVFTLKSDNPAFTKILAAGVSFVSIFLGFHMLIPIWSF